jgi:hypothetical protein
MITGYMEYFRSIRSVTMNIHLLSMEWITTGFHSVIVGAFCGGAGWVGKKIAEVGYNCITEYFKTRKSKK